MPNIGYQNTNMNYGDDGFEDYKDGDMDQGENG